MCTLLQALQHMLEAPRLNVSLPLRPESKSPLNESGEKSGRRPLHILYI
jgi:hypothetical protein